MSKERDLLSKAIELIQIVPMMASIGNVPPDFGSELILKIQELLAKPEEEGVYQKILRIEDGIEVEILPSELWLDGYETGRKDPQKRESIDDGELEVWYSQHTWAMDKQEYIWGFKDAEKCHGIGGGECVAT